MSVILYTKIYFYIKKLENNLKKIEENIETNKKCIIHLQKLIKSNRDDIARYSEILHEQSNILNCYIKDQTELSKRINEIKQIANIN